MTAMTILSYLSKEKQMGIKKFIKDVQEFLDLDDFSETKKKKALKKLLKKLDKRKNEVKNRLTTELTDSLREETQEELKLIKYQIKKGKKLLDKLKKDNKES